MTSRPSRRHGPLAAAPAYTTENLDWAAIGKIRDEGFRRSQVMETAAQLTDVHGPRLSGSPQYKQAAEWAKKQLESWGLANAHLESVPVRPRLELRAQLGARGGAGHVPAAWRSRRPGPRAPAARCAARCCA